ncbi:MAG: helix-turn-helix transcriptional regulator [Bacteroidota bacterium]
MAFKEKNTLRQQAGITQQEIADFLAMSRVNVINMEKGRQRISAPVLYLMACIYKKPINEFFPEPLNFELQIKEEVIKVPAKTKKVKKRVIKLI